MNLTPRYLLPAFLALCTTACSTTTASQPSSTDVRAPIVHSLPPLPYKYSALEPVVDTTTMTIHHQKHHQAYVDNLNKALKDTPLASRSLEEIFSDMGSAPIAVRNNGGGHYNHSLFWRIMTSPKKQTSPSPELLQAINASFGSVDKMKEALNAAAMSRFGSGWAWLVKTPTGLVITSTANQDNPLMSTTEVRGTPILGLDVWEHAYYLKHQNKRADYVKAWWSVVNWDEVSANFAK